MPDPGKVKQSAVEDRRRGNLLETEVNRGQDGIGGEGNKGERAWRGGKSFRLTMQGRIMGFAGWESYRASQLIRELKNCLCKVVSCLWQPAFKILNFGKLIVNF